MLRIAAILFSLSIWLGWSAFMLYMGITHGGLSAGVLPYGNLLGVLLFQAFAAPLAIFITWFNIQALKKRVRHD